MTNAGAHGGARTNTDTPGVDAAALTPMMAQYLQMKAQTPDALLFFRLGDFYELFFEDAVKASELLQIVLTTRSKGPERIPMAGVPYHAARRYLARLIEAGHKVAICEQLTPPGKGIVKREIVRVITPGMALDEALLESRENNFLAAVLPGDATTPWGAALIDASTGEFVALQPGSVNALAEELARAMPRELVVPTDKTTQLKLLLSLLSHPPLVATLEPDAFRLKRATAYLQTHFGVQCLDGFGLQHAGPSVGAAGAALRYVRETQKAQATHVDRMSFQSRGDVLMIDEVSRANLELQRTLKGNSRAGSLLHLVDRSATPLGARKLARWLTAPLCDVAAIGKRHDAVAELFMKGAWREQLLTRLKKMADIERLCGRLSLGCGTPRDISILGCALSELPALAALLSNVDAVLLAELAPLLSPPPIQALAATLRAALVDEPAATVANGGFIREGYHRELDALIQLSVSGKDYLAKLEAREREATGISSLKVRYNKVFGYYLEVTRPNLHLVPKAWIRKQTTVSGERYVTEELKTYEEKVLTAEEKRIALEQQLFEVLRTLVLSHTSALKTAADAVATLDALIAFARISSEANYVRPTVDDSGVIEIEGGRHPVVEAVLGGEAFIPNDMRMNADEAQVLIITGPNMAGKSTVIRQVALTTILAQAGCFVPAVRARIGVVDRLFARVGASDSLTKAQSTFMVEMSETAYILHHATRRSLVVLDEIGRGTSTFDGMSIAWAVVEYLHDCVGARTLFATHYHELSALEQVKTRIRNCSIAVKEREGGVLFLRKLVAGAASRSYGVEVARLAGLPRTVVARAKQLVEDLETGETGGVGQLHRPTRERETLPLEATPPPVPSPHPVLEALHAFSVDAATPLDALSAIAHWKQQLHE